MTTQPRHGSLFTGYDNQALRLAGNGVVPQQAAHAIRLCLNQIRNWSQP